MRQRDIWGNFFQALYRYLLFFALVAFVVTCCMSLFLTTLTEKMGLTFTADDINTAAKLTFANVMILSLLFTLLDALRRKYTVQKPVRHLVEAAERIMQGDFSVQLQPQRKILTDPVFDELTECFNHMAKELQSVETLRMDFIANVSHEMKTPLAVMRNYGMLLQTPNLSEEDRMSYAKGVTDGSRRLADMMTNILKLNRLENQTIFPQTTVFDLGEQLCESLLQYEDVWEREGIEIETDLAQDVLVRADQELLRLVWNNLLSNAFKFTPAGGCVSVSLTADAQYATVQVRDTGCGMSAEVGAHIFEKFYQGDSSHAAQGNGLGLALVKRVVDILRAQIGVESTLGSGTTFTVTLRRGETKSAEK